MSRLSLWRHPGFDQSIWQPKFLKVRKRADVGEVFHPKQHCRSGREGSCAKFQPGGKVVFGSSQTVLPSYGFPGEGGGVRVGHVV